jgi:hypothetical protein
VQRCMEHNGGCPRRLQQLGSSVKKRGGHKSRAVRVGDPMLRTLPQAALQF